MSADKPTLSNLKKVVKKPDEPESYARYVVRPISICFAWLFVRTPISANQVTVMQQVSSLQTWFTDWVAPKLRCLNLGSSRMVALALGGPTGSPG